MLIKALVVLSKQYESRQQALRRSAGKAKEKMQQDKGTRPLR